MIERSYYRKNVTYELNHQLMLYYKMLNHSEIRENELGILIRR
jgi:hypothetical protein